MGKNITGGKNNKKYANKNNNLKSNKLRLSENEYEKYAIVLRMSGGSICRVRIDNSDNELICHIRGKYRGKNKNSNLITSGNILLVGLRPDMSSNNECDLLYVYDSNEIEQLLNFPNLKISLLINNDDNKSINKNDIVIFSNDIDIIDNNIISDSDNKIDHELIDIDDI